MPLRNVVVLTCAVAIANLFGAPQPQVLEFDPARTTVTFTLGSLLHTVHGTFKLTRGVVRFDPDTGAASGQLVIDAASGESGNESRDGRMKKSVLETGKYPEITFVPDRVQGKPAAQGASHVEVHGTFRIHGVDHELTLPVEVRPAPGEIAAQTHFAVPYVDWGMKNPSTLFLRVDKTVEIEIQAVARDVAR